MKTTLEVRWFVKGMPPAVVQRWFRLECPGKLLEEEPETREDLYAYKEGDRLSQHRTIPSFAHQNSGGNVTNIEPQFAFDEFPRLQSSPLPYFEYLSHLVDYEEVNLKLRQDKLELKLRQQELGVEQFGEVNHQAIWTGNIERWCKLSEDELKAFNTKFASSSTELDWISVYKCRQQKLSRGVASELTRLKVNHESWWSIAFEMSQNSHNSQGAEFKQVVEQAAQNYYGPKLLASNSYGYSSWQAQIRS